MWVPRSISFYTFHVSGIYGDKLGGKFFVLPNIDFWGPGRGAKNQKNGQKSHLSDFDEILTPDQIFGVESENKNSF